MQARHVTYLKQLLFSLKTSLSTVTDVTDVRTMHRQSSVKVRTFPYHAVILNFNPSLCRVLQIIPKRLQIMFSVRIYPSLGHICLFLLLCFVLFWFYLYQQDMQNKVFVKLFTNL